MALSKISEVDLEFPLAGFNPEEGLYLLIA